MLIGLSGFSLLGASGYQIISYFLYIYFLQEKYFSFCYYKAAINMDSYLCCWEDLASWIYFISFICYVYNFLDVQI